MGGCDEEKNNNERGSKKCRVLYQIWFDVMGRVNLPAASRGEIHFFLPASSR